MKTMIKTLAVTFAVFAMPQISQAQIQPFLKNEIDRAIEGCMNISAKIDGSDPAIDRSLILAALPQCYSALSRLDLLEKNYGQQMNVDERNYFYYSGGNVIWVTAGSEAFLINNSVTQGICQQVYSAERSWRNIRLPQNSRIMNEVATNPLRRALLPACQRSFPGR